MRINKDKGIGTVIFIVEGQKFELSLLKRIFVDILDYQYFSKKRGKRNYYQRGKNPISKVFVVNSKSSNLGSIEDADYIDNLYKDIIENCNIEIDDAAIFFLFDRDPKSNTKHNDYSKFHDKYIDPWENPENYNGGQLLLSYPSIESYELSCFIGGAYERSCQLGEELKSIIASEEYRQDIQLNKLDYNKLIHATQEFLEYIRFSKLKYK